MEFLSDIFGNDFHRGWARDSIDPLHQHKFDTLKRYIKDIVNINGTPIFIRDSVCNKAQVEYVLNACSSDNNAIVVLNAQKRPGSLRHVDDEYMNVHGLFYNITSHKNDIPWFIDCSKIQVYLDRGCKEILHITKTTRMNYGFEVTVISYEDFVAKFFDRIICFDITHARADATCWPKDEPIKREKSIVTAPNRVEEAKPKETLSYIVYVNGERKMLTPDEYKSHQAEEEKKWLEYREKCRQEEEKRRIEDEEHQKQRMERYKEYMTKGCNYNRGIRCICGAMFLEKDDFKEHRGRFCPLRVKK